MIVEEILLKKTLGITGIPINLFKDSRKIIWLPEIPFVYYGIIIKKLRLCIDYHYLLELLFVFALVKRVRSMFFPILF